MKTKLSKKVTRYADILGQEWKTQDQAESSSHETHLKFRKYIEEELLVAFSDGRIDKISTTQAIWDSLEFTNDCIKEICDIMDK